LRPPHQGEFRRCRFAYNDGASFANPLDANIIILGNVFPKHQASPGCGHAADKEIIFDSYRNPIYRAAPAAGTLPCGRFFRSLQRTLAVKKNESVQHRLKPIAAVKIHLQEFSRRDFVGVEHAIQGRRVGAPPI
jgi:hypothetical protein